MLENLTERLQSVIKTIRGQSRFSEENISDAMREVRIALIEADVALPVVRYFIDRVKDKVLGAEVLESVTPDQAIIKIVQDELLIITATNSYITKPIGDLFGIDDLIGTDLEEVGGEFTGKVKGIPSFKEGKVDRLNLLLKQKKLTFEDFEQIFFYSDSQNDLPLLRAVSNPVAANPDEVLKKEAVKNKWPIISLR